MKIDNDTELEDHEPVFDRGVIGSRERTEPGQPRHPRERRKRWDLRRRGLLATEWD
jgi:hypothetical protein